ncbi:MAG: tetratricopeptide repeat protein, partial [Campylobacterota bacterium]|nr:tetratricopeptide repeat protein [Campylobacterota bacterium]
NAGVFDYFKDENRIAFEIASEYYRDGEYEKALVHYETVKSANSQFKSSVYFNIANSFVRLKEFKKARENYLKSLTLFYSIEADENLRYIKNVSEEKIMKTGQQKSDKKSSMAKKEQSGKKRKEGGASNMKVSANVSDGAGDIGKKTESDPMLSLDSSKARLSSKQYELINKRGVDEISPW